MGLNSGLSDKCSNPSLILTNPTDQINNNNDPNHVCYSSTKPIFSLSENKEFCKPKLLNILYQQEGYDILTHRSMICAADLHAESRVEYPTPIYVPHDEAFEEGKQEMLSAGARKALLHNLVPALVASISPESHDFKAFHDIDNLFKEGLRLKKTLQDQLFHKIPFVSKIEESSEALLRFDTPDIITSKPIDIFSPIMQVFKKNQSR